jgi:hypothetical protein
VMKQGFSSTIPNKQNSSHHNGYLHRCHVHKRPDNSEVLHRCAMVSMGKHPEKWQNGE